MRRTVVLCILAGALLLQGPATTAHPGHERPKITVMKWKEPPVTPSTGECDEQGNCDEEILIVKAHDPDSSITEVVVRYERGDGTGSVLFAHTYCVQGKAAGIPARLELGIAFDQPGEYVVEAVAYSHKRCLAHQRGDRHPQRHSRIKRLATTVQE